MRVIVIFIFIAILSPSLAMGTASHFFGKSVSVLEYLKRRQATNGGPTSLFIFRLPSKNRGYPDVFVDFLSIDLYRQDQT
jgi:hypothetical protein